MPRVAGLLKNGSLPIMSAPAPTSGSAANAASKSKSLRACRTCNLMPRVAAAASTARAKGPALAGVSGLTSSAMAGAVGTSSRTTSSCFGPSSTAIEVTPVMLPPGLLRLATSPIAIGSPAVTKTIGIVVVAAFAASAGGAPANAAITATLRETRLASSAGNRS